MPWTNFLLAIHVIGAVFIFGPTVAFSFIGLQAKKQGAPVAWAIGLTEFIENKWVTPLALTLQPASGALLIIAGKNRWNPFESYGRWLLAGIILYIIANAYSIVLRRLAAMLAPAP